MKKMLLVLFLLLPTPVLACGWPSLMLSAYWNPDTDRQTKEALLGSVGCDGHVNYLPREDDPVIAAVAIDAIRQGLSREPVETLLGRFHCAYAARHEEDYAVIRSFIGEQRYDEFCRTIELQRILIVNVTHGAILRDAPGGQRLTAIPSGAYVKRVAELEGWYEVDGGLYGDGYIRRDLLVPY